MVAGGSSINFTGDSFAREGGGHLFTGRNIWDTGVGVRSAAAAAFTQLLRRLA